MQPIRRAVALLQLNTVLLLALVLAFRQLESFGVKLSALAPEEGKRWQVKGLLASVALCKLVLVTTMRNQAKRLVLGYFADFALNWTLAMLLSLVTPADTYLSQLRVICASLFVSLSVLQAFFATRLQLSGAVAALLLTAMLFANLGTLGVFGHAFNDCKVSVQAMAFDLLLLTFANTYLMLCSRFLAEFKSPRNSVSGALNVYFAIQSDWTLRLWRDLGRSVSLRPAIKSNKSLPTEQKMCDSDPDGPKTTADSVELGEDDLNDGLSVSAIY